MSKRSTSLADEGHKRQKQNAEKGTKQAREVAAALKDEPITHVLASPYLRVLQTAQPLAQALGKPLCTAGEQASGSSSQFSDPNRKAV